MSQIIFSTEEIDALAANPYVKNASEKSITYTTEFREKFMSEYKCGKLPSQIFKDAGFDVKVLGKQRIKEFSRRCRKMSLRPEGFEDTRKEKSGRPSTNELTSKEEILRLKQKIKYLEQENKFLKKIEFLDRQAEWKEKRKRRQTKSSNLSEK